MFPLLNPRLVERFRKLFNFRRTYMDDPVIAPVVVVNDVYSESRQVTANAERTTTGTTTLYTAQNNLTETYVTTIMLTFSDLNQFVIA